MSSPRRRARMRAILFVTAVAVATMVAAAPAGAKIAPATASHGRIGFEPSLSYQKAHPTSCSTDCSLLTLHSGGVVQHGEKLYSIYWAPKGYYIPPAYKTGLGQWITDFSRLDYGPTSDFSVAQQYYDLSGTGGAKNFVANGLVNGGNFNDLDAYPANGCTDSDNGPNLPVCFTQAQLQTEVSNFVAAHSLPKGPNVQYLVFTPQNVGSCFDSSSSSCAYKNYCAYHGHLGTGSTQIVYANMPWSYNTPNCDAVALWNFGYANGSAIDPEVGVLSHEIIETMTDVDLNAWYDGVGNEIGDKCAYNYDGVHVGSGTTGLKSDGLGLYNQFAGGDYYLMQTEFSNRNSNGSSTGCIGKNTDTQPTVTTTITPNPPVHGSSAQFKATITDPAGVSSVVWTFGDGATATGNPVNHTYAAAGTDSVSVIVTDGHGNTKRLIQTVTVH
jgi:hypothetical protein